MKYTDGFFPMGETLIKSEFNEVLGVDFIGNQKDVCLSNHILMVGACGSGKSIQLKAFVKRAIDLDNWKVACIDVRNHEFEEFKGKSKIFNCYNSTLEYLEKIVNLVEKRHEEISLNNKTHIHEVNPDVRLTLIAIDEYEMFAKNDEVIEKIKQAIELISKLGAPAGVHLVITTQRVGSELISTETMKNFSTRIACGRLQKHISAMTFGNEEIANNILMNARCLAIQTPDQDINYGISFPH